MERQQRGSSPPSGKESGSTETREIVTGRRWSAPFVYVAGVAGFVWAVAGLIAAGALLLWWLV